MKCFSILFLSLFFLFSACQKEEKEEEEEGVCASVICENGGYCYGGDCRCEELFYGANCEIAMNGFTIDSIVVQYNTRYGPSGNLIEGSGEGEPDLLLEFYHIEYTTTGLNKTRLHTTSVNHEVPISTKSTFDLNWVFSTGAFSARYQLVLKDRDVSSYDLIRDIDFTFENIRGEGSQIINTDDGQFTATLYYSYQ
jgi:hypothetical protein